MYNQWQIHDFEERVPTSHCTRVPARGVWGHAPSGKYQDSGLQRSFLMQFGGNITRVRQPAAKI